MGLDNIPHTYPCRSQGLALLTAEDTIDCEATIRAGRCPHAREAPQDGAVYGMLGTACWYRGKVGQWMVDKVETITGESAPHSLYGYDRSDGQADLSAGECLDLAKWLADRGERYLEHVRTTVTEEQLRVELAQQYTYLVWWLRWVARNCDGADAWY